MGLTLRFCARKDCLVNSRPGEPVQVGIPAKYIGRAWDDASHGYSATDAVFECDSESVCGRELLRLFRQTPKTPPLWPADEQTAKACGQRYVRIEFRDGEWSPAAPKQETKNGAGPKK